MSSAAQQTPSLTQDQERDLWFNNRNPKHIQIPAHGSSVATCLTVSRGRIITASDDHSIHVYSPFDGTLLQKLDGHEGGVWSMQAINDTLVSGSTDRTIRVWDISSGRCKHVFGGHTSTVRCLAIVTPEVEVGRDGTRIVNDGHPDRALIVSGSRDHSLRIWTLPLPDEDEYSCFQDGNTEDPADPVDNPYHRRALEGHDNAVRDIAAAGAVAISGSYDCTVRIWDIITGECKHVLRGHTQKVYSVAFDAGQHKAFSGSMDGTVRVWDTLTGEALHILTGHTSLVGLLALSPSYLVSGAADATLRVWNPDNGELCHLLAGHSGAITCFQHDEDKVASGSDGKLSLWDIRTGKAVRNILTDVAGVWQVAFAGTWCIAVSNRNDSTMLDVWDFSKSKEDEVWEGAGPKGPMDEVNLEAYLEIVV